MMEVAGAEMDQPSSGWEGGKAATYFTGFSVFHCDLVNVITLNASKCLLLV